MVLQNGAGKLVFMIVSIDNIISCSVEGNKVSHASSPIRRPNVMYTVVSCDVEPCIAVGQSGLSWLQNLFFMAVLFIIYLLFHRLVFKLILHFQCFNVNYCSEVSCSLITFVFYFCIGLFKCSFWCSFCDGPNWELQNIWVDWTTFSRLINAFVSLT